MSKASHRQRSDLTPYETEQVRQIAAWKSAPPNPLSELWKRIALPVASAVEKLIPDPWVREAVEAAYRASDILAGQESVKRRAGVRDLAELKSWPLEECDRLARGAGASAQSIALVEGAATGAGGVITTMLDVPLLFVLAIASIRKIGHCYGYSLDAPQDRHFVTGVLIASMAGWLELRRQRLDELHEIEDLLIEEIQEDILVDEALSFLFQLEIFEDIPGIGTVVGRGAELDVHAAAWTRRPAWSSRSAGCGTTARSKRSSRPRPTRGMLAGGWSGVFSRAAYSGFYYLGFGVSLPACAVAALFRPMDNALTRGLRDGAAAAVERAGVVASSAQAARTRSLQGQTADPALVRG